MTNRERSNKQHKVEVFGGLILFDLSSLEIEAATQNIDQFIYLTDDQIIGATLVDIDPSLAEQIYDTIDFTKSHTFFLKLDCTSSTEYCDVLIHAGGGKGVIEFVPGPDMQPDQNSLTMKRHAEFFSNIAWSRNMGEAAELVVSTLRQISDFGRVRLYLNDNSGQWGIVGEDGNRVLTWRSGVHLPSCLSRKSANKYFELNRFIYSHDTPKVATNVLDEAFEHSGLCGNLVTKCAPSKAITSQRIMGAKSIICFPIWNSDKLVGVCDFHHVRPAFLPASLFSLIESILHEFIVVEERRARNLEQEPVMLGPSDWQADIINRIYGNATVAN